MQSDIKEWPASEYVKLFLNDGAIIQTSIDSFKLFIGPFESVKELNSDLNKEADLWTQQNLLFKPDFWDFQKQSLSELSLQRPSNLKPSLLKAQKVIDISRKKLIELFSGDSLLEDGLNLNIKWESPDLNQFYQQFVWLKQQIQKGLLFKGLPITVQNGSEFELSLVARIKILKNILQKTSEQYLYGFWSTTSGFIGFTPEVLVEKSKNEFSTMALAGTWAKSAGLVHDFKNSKIQNEHMLVVEDILKQLSDEKLFFKSNTEVLELEYLFHLKTKFKYNCVNHKTYSENISGVKKIIQNLHPTAALGLFPRSEQLFSEFQKFELQNQRQNFGAPFGVIGPEHSFILVAIRNIFWQKDKISIYSGCGVTADSDFETEWQELESKRNSVKKTFGFNL